MNQNWKLQKPKRFRLKQIKCRKNLKNKMSKDIDFMNNGMQLLRK